MKSIRVNSSNKIYKLIQNELNICYEVGIYPMPITNLFTNKLGNGFYVSYTELGYIFWFIHNKTIEQLDTICIINQN